MYKYTHISVTVPPEGDQHNSCSVGAPLNMAAQPENQPQMSDDSIHSTITYQEEESPAAEDALNYVCSVKRAFGADSPQYKTFLELMKDFKDKKVDTPGVATRVKLLFAEREELLEGFNQFLPAGYKISLPLSRRSGKEFQDAVNYVTKVKSAFSENKERYTSFLNILNEYRAHSLSLREVYQKMCDIFHDKPDLLDEFCTYLPDTSEAAIEDAVNNAAQDKGIIMTKSKPLCFRIAYILSVMVVAIGAVIAVGDQLRKS